MPEQDGKMRVSLGVLGAAAFMVIADARVIDPLLHIIADDFKTGVGSAAEKACWLLINSIFFLPRL